MSGLLTSPRSIIKKEACWTISNITAGNPHQIQLVIDVCFYSLIILFIFFNSIQIRVD